MKNFLFIIKGKIISTASSLLSVIGAGSSSAGAVCQTTCSTSSSVLPFLGLSLAATPFAFLQTYQVYIWWLALSLFSLTLWVYLKKELHVRFELGLLLVNAGLLAIGFPYFRDLPVIILAASMGVALWGLGIYYIATAKKFVIQLSSHYEVK